MGSGTQALLIALIAALLTGTPALVWAIVRAKRVGPAEEDELVSRAASQAVAAMDTALKAAMDERQELVRKVEQLEAEVGRVRESNRRCVERMNRLEAICAANGLDVG